MPVDRRTGSKTALISVAKLILALSKSKSLTVCEPVTDERWGQKKRKMIKKWKNLTLFLHLFLTSHQYIIRNCTIAIIFQNCDINPRIQISIRNQIFVIL